MELLSVVAVMVLVGGVAAFVLTPLRRGAASVSQAEARRDAEIAVLEARKEAKYREIRETELDYRMGKLAEDEWRAQDRQLRREAIDLLEALDALGVDDAGTARSSASSSAGE